MLYPPNLNNSQSALHTRDSRNEPLCPSSRTKQPYTAIEDSKTAVSFSKQTKITIKGLCLHYESLGCAKTSYTTQPSLPSFLSNSSHSSSSHSYKLPFLQHKNSFISIIISEIFDTFKTPSSANFNTRFGTPIAIDAFLCSAFFCSSTLMCFPNNFGMKTWRSDSGLLITVLSLAYFKSSVQRIAEMQRMRTEGPDRIFFFEVNDDFQSGMICLILPKRSESSCGCSASCKYCSILKKETLQSYLGKDVPFRTHRIDSYYYYYYYCCCCCFLRRCTTKNKLLAPRNPSWKCQR